MQAETVIMIKLLLAALLAYLSVRKVQQISVEPPSQVEPNMVPDIELIEEEQEEHPLPDQ